jgi:hypothetical protein
VSADEADDLDGEEPAEEEEPPADPVAEARRMRRRLGVALGVVVLAVTGLGLAFPGRQVRPGAGEYQATSADPIQAALPVLRSFVEHARGLRFSGPVTVTVLDAASFARVAGQPLPQADGAAPPDRAATDQALRLAHLAPGGTTGDPTAFYSYTRHRMYLRDGPFDAFARAVLVHELTHALQDQRFDLLSLAQRASRNADQARALTALIEGDATRVELAYVTSRPAAERQQIRARYNYDARPTDYAGNVRYFPYTYGRDFVAQLAATGGDAAVDAAFGSPPVSTAQIIDPRLYARSVQPVGVRLPQAGGAVLDSGTLGRFGLAMLSTGGRRVLNAGATSAWLGDAYVTYRSGRGFCTRGNVVLDGTNAQQQLLTDLSRRPGQRFVTTFGGDTVRFEFCT